MYTNINYYRFSIIVVYDDVYRLVDSFDEDTNPDNDDSIHVLILITLMIYSLPVWIILMKQQQPGLSQHI